MAEKGQRSVDMVIGCQEKFSALDGHRLEFVNDFRYIYTKDEPRGSVGAVRPGRIWGSRISILVHAVWIALGYSFVCMRCFDEAQFCPETARDHNASYGTVFRCSSKGLTYPRSHGN